MFGFFKKKVKSLEFCVLFIKAVTPIIEHHKNELNNWFIVESKVIKFFEESNIKLSNEQLMTVRHASMTLCINEELQEKILVLHNSSIEDTKDRFLDIWNDFKSIGCFYE
jgi:hypothetical protein